MSIVDSEYVKYEGEVSERPDGEEDYDKAFDEDTLSMTTDVLNERVGYEDQVLAEQYFEAEVKIDNQQYIETHGVPMNPVGSIETQRLTGNQDLDEPEGDDEGDDENSASFGAGLPTLAEVNDEALDVLVSLGEIPVPTVEQDAATVIEGEAEDELYYEEDADVVPFGGEELEDDESLLTRVNSPAPSRVIPLEDDPNEFQEQPLPPRVFTSTIIPLQSPNLLVPDAIESDQLFELRSYITRAIINSGQFPQLNYPQVILRGRLIFNKL